MTMLMRWLRHLFIIIPAGATLLIRPIELSSDLLIICILLALLAARLSEHYPRYTTIIAIMEFIGFGYMSYEWGGFLYLLPYSTLIAVFSLSLPLSALIGWTVGGLAIQFIALDQRSLELRLPDGLLWLMLAATLITARQLADRRQHTEQLYDQLANQHEELEAARRRLLEYAAQIELHAQTEERNRIARDIHDDLGHQLIRVKMMSEAALHLFEVDIGRARSTVEQIRDQLQISMERMRQTVRKLSAPDASSNVYSMEKLVKEARSSLGINIFLSYAGQPHTLYPSIEYVLYRNAQEAITNAVRHGGATEVTIIVDYREDGTALIVSNDGSVPEGPLTNGIGMRGMVERASLVGGVIDCEWQNSQRFTVTTWLPALQDTTR
ncbi:sensor histidine kinase [Paenibacillus xylaniclasticus]|uniref:sensor histidine kinase n=1 Tax=Paenibacillus xylaniclasticus TaxID=588083 RepID=UPI000FD8113C|nr:MULTISPECIES: sensor histidine kinase [Paenibacillus]GFN32043.1 histidine kinase [Paenibacillus curdlanolyticus]